jgi:predicted dithiol-disulfide oxidoreductase (DUF899 family)
MEEQVVFRRWPSNASEEYIAARNQLLQAELGLRDQIEHVAALRRALPPGAPMPAYTFEEGPRSLEVQQGDENVIKITLQELVGDRSLVIYHLMFAEDEDEPCPMCSMWIDGFDGVVSHFEQRVDFAVIAKAPLAKLRSWARARGWNNLRLLSSSSTTFNADMNLEHPDWMPSLKQGPGISVFRNEGGVVRHVYSCPPEFAPGKVRAMDLLSPVWNLLDIVPEGRGEWYPSHSYAMKGPGAKKD